MYKKPETLRDIWTWAILYELRERDYVDPSVYSCPTEKLLGEIRQRGTDFDLSGYSTEAIIEELTSRQARYYVEIIGPDEHRLITMNGLSHILLVDG